ncbi:hypothetical protein N7447_011249 [Penicillium robsamsonii]|uniref:uncharacterized protein n=1 Tax=Penicillium robsamsonii TaxID=1792511 RepID=UPI0025484C0F|nr:uncharacterized protein N7447_011249 [Penicillium robsamsonii]KAJ5807237.1 hypothetical protein N7447_011249 [Penicillium robsamsonii]
MTTQAGVALSEASPQRKPRPQRLRECHAVGAPAQARYPPGAKVVISAPLSRGSLLASGAEESPSAVPPPKVSPPPQVPGRLAPSSPPSRPGARRLPSVEFPPAPPEARPPANWQTSTPAKSPASKPQWRPGPIMLPACHPPANRPLSKAPAPSPPLPPVVPADTPLPRGQHAIPSLPWPLNQLASILAAQIRARGPSSGFPLQAPGAAGSIDGEV